MGEVKTDEHEGLTKQDISMLYFYKDIGPDVQRIIILVQANADYFGKRLGHSCVKIAADKLEELVKDHNGTPL